MTPDLLLALAGLVAALPALVDAWLATKIKMASLLALATMGVGLLFGGLGGLLTQVAQGSDWKTAATVFATGLGVGALTALVNWLKGQASPPAQGSAGGSAGASGGSSPRGMGAMMRMAVAAGVLAVAFGVACIVSACSLFTPANVRNASDVAICVLQHDQEPPMQIAEECGPMAVADVIAILSAHQAAAKRDSAAHASDAGAE